MSEPKSDNCSACGAKPGEPHQVGCDVKTCLNWAGEYPLEIWPNGTIISGYRRVQALKALGLGDIKVVVKPVSSSG